MKKLILSLIATFIVAVFSLNNLKAGYIYCDSYGTGVVEQINYIYLKSATFTAYCDGTIYNGRDGFYNSRVTVSSDITCPGISIWSNCQYRPYEDRANNIHMIASTRFYYDVLANAEGGSAAVAHAWLSW